MSTVESGNGAFMGLPPLGKPLKRLYVWGGDCGFVLVERMDKKDLTARDVRKVARAMLEEADKAEGKARAAEVRAKVAAFREALQEGRAWEALDRLERKGLRRIGRGQSISRMQRINLFRKGLINGGGQLTEDGKRALQQLAPAGETSEPRMGSTKTSIEPEGNPAEQDDGSDMQ